MDFSWLCWSGIRFHSAKKARLSRCIHNDSMCGMMVNVSKNSLNLVSASKLIEEEESHGSAYQSSHRCHAVRVRVLDLQGAKVGAMATDASAGRLLERAGFDRSH